MNVVALGREAFSDGDAAFTAQQQSQSAKDTAVILTELSAGILFFPCCYFF